MLILIDFNIKDRLNIACIVTNISIEIGPYNRTQNFMIFRLIASFERSNCKWVECKGFQSQS